MKRNFAYLLCVLCFSFGNTMAQDVTTVEALDSEISQNLDLEAIASVFGESENLEDFEKKLNDPDTQISNLDLNGDGEVDYLRVLENSKEETHLITIQAVIAKDQYQDVATIDVEKDSNGETQVQVVGDVFMYGPDYIITPVYVHSPVIFVWFWGPMYHPWRSPFYYGYYPPYYRPWAPYPPHRYRTNVHVHVNVTNTYHRTTVRTSRTSVEIQNRTRRNDYGAKHPGKSHGNRKSNSGDTQKTRPNNNGGGNASEGGSKVSTGKPVQKDWKPNSEKKGQNSKVQNNKVTVPSNKQPTKAKPNQSKQSKPTQSKEVKPNTTPQNKSQNTKQSKTQTKLQTEQSSKPQSTQSSKSQSTQSSKSKSTQSSKSQNTQSKKTQSSPKKNIRKK